MSEANPNGQRDSNELRELIRELESQIEGVNAGLGKIRGTVARIAFASLGTATPPASSLWSNGHSVAPANGQWQTASVEAPPALPAQPQPATPTPEPLVTAPEQEAAPGFWTSVAEGASWPRAHTAADAEAPAHEGLGHTQPAGFPSPSPSGPWAVTPEAKLEDAGFLSWGAPAEESAGPDAILPEPGAVQTVDPQAEAVDATGALSPESTAPESEAWMLETAVEPASPVAETASTVEAPSFGVQMPSTLSSGWPDESAWSQSFEWGAMKTDAPEVAGAPPVPSEGAFADVSDIVAQVRAELEAARAQGIVLPQDAEEEYGATAAEVPTGDSSEDDDARREEVSRAVAEMRAQLQSGDFDGTMPGVAFEGADGVSSPVEQPVGSDEEVRDEVRRAVEAAREELSGIRGGTASGGEKPAFRLAAPGSIPDWSHMKVEQSGPPVVVMKDVDGRVELASVYETLNELGCGDGAALLNYTPHSVTVGLPVTSQVPSREQVAIAVEKVFGLTSRVESDGVRITVSIGVDPKRRSVA